MVGTEHCAGEGAGRGRGFGRGLVEFEEQRAFSWHICKLSQASSSPIY